MNPFDVVQAQPFGSSRDETADYRRRVLDEVGRASTEWVFWTGMPQPHRRLFEARSNPWLSRIPPEAVCICVEGDPCFWRREWLYGRLSRWDDRLPAARFLPEDLKPGDESGIFRLNPKSRAGETASVTARRSASGSRLMIERESIAPILAAMKGRGHLAANETPGERPCPEPAVSILMSIHNMKGTMGWSIRSVLAQSSPAWELLIGDDGSDDDSLEEARFFPDPRVKVLLQSRNRGKAVMMNRLLEEARGRFILELDGDDWLAPDAVRLLSEALDLAPEAGMATASYAWWARTRQCGPVWRSHAAPGCLPDRERASAAFAHPLVPRMYRRRALIDIGGWWNREDRFGRIFEDIDVASRLLERYSLRTAPPVLYHRVISGGSISQRSRHLFPAWADWRSDAYAKEV